MSPAEIRDFLDRHGLAAHRSRGQNFLHDDALADKLAATAQVGPEDAVLEIGTGLGILTHALARRARLVVSVEVDSGLVRGLAAEGGLPDSVELLHADALELDWEATLARAPGPWRVVANLPYSVATPLLRQLLDRAGDLAGYGVMVQRELARRIAAPVQAKDYGSFAVIHQLCVDVAATLDLHGQCFYPVPNVVSRFLTLVPRRTDRPGRDELASIERVVRAGFAHRRKTVANSLQRAGGWPPEQIAEALAHVGLDAGLRAERISPPEWRALAARLASPA